MDLLRATSDEARQKEEFRLLSLAMEWTDRAVLVLDHDERIVYANHAFTDMFGYGSAEVIGGRPTEFLAGVNTDPVALQRMQQNAWGNQGFPEEALFYSKDGREVWISGKVSPAQDSSGNMVIVFSNITETKQIQSLQHSVLEAVAGGSPLPAIADLICRRVEAIAPEVISSMVLLDNELKLIPLAAPSMPEEYSAALRGLPIGENAGSCGTAAFLGEPVCVTDIESDPRWENYKQMVLPLGLRACWSSPIKMRDGRVAGTFAFYYREKRAPSNLHKELVAACVHLCIMAIEQDAAKQQIARLSHFDLLTGLPNRSRLHEMAGNLLANMSGGVMNFFAVDIDNFKDVNNMLGHSAGDQILVEVAYRLQKLAQPHGVVSRVEGNAFVMVMRACSSTYAVAMAEKIQKALNEPFDIPCFPLSISASVGISVAEDKRAAANVLIEQALTAVHQAKSTGRGGYRFYSPEMNKLAEDRLLLGAALRHALAEGSLRMHYQPQFRLKTMELVGVEALSRWTDDRLGEILPERFIPLAEETGQIEPVGLWSLREACRQMARWRRVGVPVPAVSVNLSPLHFHNGRLPELVDGLLQEYRLPAKCLTIEITESVMMDNRPESLKTVMALHEIGVGLSMDDFGTGFSSLAGLSRLPITELKLDRSFMSNLETNASAQAVATAVIRIGQSLGLAVVSEGVETEAQARLLASLDCDIVQGYLYGRPMPPEDFENRLASNTLIA